MSRDFAPKDHVLAHQIWVKSGKQSPYLSNIIMCFDGIEKPMYTDEELQDRQNHETAAIMCSDIYSTLRKKLSTEEFDTFNFMLTDLKDKFLNRKPLDFPKPVLTWFFNKNNHYYHEPNDEEFMEFILKRREKYEQRV